LLDLLDLELCGLHQLLIFLFYNMTIYYIILLFYVVYDYFW
jgi:hypothetical protein